VAEGAAMFCPISTTVTPLRGKSAVGEFRTADGAGCDEAIIVTSLESGPERIPELQQANTAQPARGSVPRQASQSKLRRRLERLADSGAGLDIAIGNHLLKEL